jgi:DNA-binding response OmpR family regulator
VHVLVVEDHERILSFLRKGLQAEGYVATTATDAETALEAARATAPELAIVDVMLRGRDDGFALIPELRALVPGIPVILLTARSSIEDRVRGLDLGATDYVVKPFAFAELAARVRTHLRRRDGRAETLRIGPLHLDLTTRIVSLAGASHGLSAREFALLAYLMRRPNQVLSRQQLLSGVWGLDFDPRSNVVDVYIGYLRDKIGADRIETVRGVGYRLRGEPVAERIAS